jgi:hypothetical protein
VHPAKTINRGHHAINHQSTFVRSLAVAIAQCTFRKVAGGMVLLEGDNATFVGIARIGDAHRAAANDEAKSSRFRIRDDLLQVEEFDDGTGRGLCVKCPTVDGVNDRWVCGSVGERSIDWEMHKNLKRKTRFPNERAMGSLLIFNQFVCRSFSPET